MVASSDMLSFRVLAHPPNLWLLLTPSQGQYWLKLMQSLPQTFKRLLRTSLLNILQNEDDYIQIPVIIKKVGEVG